MYVKAKKCCTSLRLEETTAVKLVLSYHFVVAVESIEFFVITEFVHMQ